MSLLAINAQDDKDIGSNADITYSIQSGKGNIFGQYNTKH